MQLSPLCLKDPDTLLSCSAGPRLSKKKKDTSISLLLWRKHYHSNNSYFGIPDLDFLKGHQQSSRDESKWAKVQCLKYPKTLFGSIDPLPPHILLFASACMQIFVTFVYSLAVISFFVMFCVVVWISLSPTFSFLRIDYKKKKKKEEGF